MLNVSLKRRFFEVSKGGIDSGLKKIPENYIFWSEIG